MKNPTCLGLVLITLTIFVTTSNGNILNFTQTKFTPWRQNVTYVSSTTYDAKGMGAFYKATNKVLDIVVGEELIPDGYIVVHNQQFQPGPKAKANNWNDLLKTYWGIITIILLTLLLVILMPIVGLCFCCCRCAGSCGGRTQPFDKKHDGCRRACYAILLICAATALLFGVVIAFVTNSYLQYGVENATTTGRENVADTRNFLQATSEEIDHLLDQNYNELSINLKIILHGTANIVINEFDKSSRAVSLTKLHQFVTILPEIHKNLEHMKSLTNQLRVNASQLNDGLRGVKRKLLVSLTQCSLSVPECGTVLRDYEIGKLDINGIDYNQLPDEMIAEVADSVKLLIDGDLISSISESEASLESVRTQLNQTITKHIPGVEKALKDAGTEIKKASTEITDSLKRTSQSIVVNSNKHLNTADEFINEYSIYRFYFGLAVSSVLLLILLCIVFGLLCGICGNRPSGYGDDCCNKGAGSKCLMLGVALIFLTISVLAVITLVHFLIGFVAHRAVCEPLKNPKDSQIFEYFDSVIDLNDVYESRTKSLSSFEPSSEKRNKQSFRISDVIQACHQNKSVFEVLRLENHVNLKDILNYYEKYNIQSELEELFKSIKLQQNIILLTEDTERAINKLASSKLNDFSSDKFVQNLGENVTNHNLHVIADKLRETADKLPNRQEMNEIRVILKNQALHLDTYQDKLVAPMIKHSDEMLLLASKLETSLHFGEKSFEVAIKLLLDEIKFAQEYITSGGTEFVQSVAKELSEKFKTEIETYLNLVVSSIETNVGRCTPISNVYNSIIVAGCNRIVDPFNGFWAGVGLCIPLFILIIILCSKLSTLYQKSDPYPGTIVEAEYLYDAYSERDNIPLANGPKSKRRKQYERRRNSRERRDYYEDTNPSHAAPSGPREARYNDMAPKHWEGGNGQPPRYQSPPIAPPDPEYERPPPYYFPGASPSQE